LFCPALQTVNIPQAGGSLSPVNKKKQVTAFAANFIQSLDATHMFKTALACSRENITFASVHDSFWTHSCDVDRLNELLRMEFVDIYDAGKESILSRLVAEFKKIYGGNLIPVFDHEQKISSWRPISFPPVPKCGNLNVSEVLNSTYFFH
jgi:DNA-directed RNA polymerase, mitochondrial